MAAPNWPSGARRDYARGFAARTADAPVRSVAEGVARQRRVLLIEDGSDAREMLRMVLELLNVVHPDVGIIDIRLPTLNGYQIAKLIREDAHGRGMLLVALSGYERLGDVDAFADEIFDCHLVKPIDPAQLMRRLNEGV